MNYVIELGSTKYLHTVHCIEDQSLIADHQLSIVNCRSLKFEVEKERAGLYKERRIPK